MNHDQVIQLLKDYRSYRYAVNNCGRIDGQPSLIYSERRTNPNSWDRSRYNRIVNMIDGAVADVLSDDQRTVIMRKYIDRNSMNINEIAYAVNRDRNTVSRWHKEAIRKLSKALMPLTHEEFEITNFDHMFTAS